VRRSGDARGWSGGERRGHGVQPRSDGRSLAVKGLPLSVADP
jgi:hypothetical protein